MIPKWYIPPIVAAFFCGAFSLLLPATSQGASPDAKKHIVMFFDVSDSIDGNLKNVYINSVKVLMMSLQEGDSFVCYKIGKGTQISDPFCGGSVPFQGDMSKYKYRDEVNAFKVRQLKSIVVFLKANEDKETSIIAAFSISQNEFAQNARGKTPYIFFFSDMDEQTPAFNMEHYFAIGASKAKPDSLKGKDKAIQDAMKYWAELGKPIIKGVKVFCIGVNIESAVEFNNVEKFWEQIIRDNVQGQLKYFRHSLAVLPEGW